METLVSGRARSGRKFRAGRRVDRRSCAHANLMHLGARGIEPAANIVEFAIKTKGFRR